MRMLFCLSNLRFLKLLPCFFLNVIGVRGLGIDGWYSLCIFDNFFIILDCLLSELVKYSHIERYLAAKIGTISVVLIYKSSCYGWVISWGGVASFLLIPSISAIFIRYRWLAFYKISFWAYLSSVVKCARFYVYAWVNLKF